MRPELGLVQRLQDGHAFQPPRQVPLRQERLREKNRARTHARARGREEERENYTQDQGTCYYYVLKKMACSKLKKKGLDTKYKRGHVHRNTTGTALDEKRAQGTVGWFLQTSCWGGDRLRRFVRSRFRAHLEGAAEAPLQVPPPQHEQLRAAPAAVHLGLWSRDFTE